MNSFDSMKQKLEPLGIYDFDGSGEAVCELKAYAEGLDTVFDTLSELEREYFIPTAESFGLSNRERFFGREQPGLSTEQRREQLIYYEKNIIGDITESGFNAFLRHIGLSDYTITLSASRSNMTIAVNDPKTDGEKALIRKQIAAEIPAFMTYTINFSE